MEPAENQRRERARELRAQIDELRRGGRESRPPSPREFADRAASDAAARATDAAHDESEEEDEPG